MLVGFVGDMESGGKDLPRICLIHSSPFSLLFSYSSFYISFSNIYNLKSAFFESTQKFSLPHIYVLRMSLYLYLIYLSLKTLFLINQQILKI